MGNPGYHLTGKAFSLFNVPAEELGRFKVYIFLNIHGLSTYPPNVRTTSTHPEISRAY